MRGLSGGGDMVPVRWSWVFFFQRKRRHTRGPRDWSSDVCSSDLATAEQRAAMRAESANADLQDALARLRDQLGAANQALGLAQSRIGALSDEANKQQVVSEQAATSKTDRVVQLTHALEQAQRELHLAEAQ